jgi:fructose-bisphosphate aldolase class II
MVALHDIQRRACREGWALPHFNISDLVTLKAIAAAAQAARAPVLIGTSEGEAGFVGYEQAVALVRSLREAYGLPFYLNADHHKSVAAAKRAIDAGYDSVHIDLSKLPLEENIAAAKEVVAYARAKSAAIAVEGEVGYLVTESSKVYREAVEVPPESLARVEDAVRFVRETGVDRLAPAVGTLHGIAANRPKIDDERIRAIRDGVGEVALVLHGGSGSTEQQFRDAIAAGIANVHINTDLRVAYVGALRTFLAANPDEVVPYKVLQPAVEAVQAVCASYLRLFGAAGRV